MSYIALQDRLQFSLIVIMSDISYSYIFTNLLIIDMDRAAFSEPRTNKPSVDIRSRTSSSVNTEYNKVVINAADIVHKAANICSITARSEERVSI